MYTLQLYRGPNRNYTQSDFPILSGFHVNLTNWNVKGLNDPKKHN